MDERVQHMVTGPAGAGRGRRRVATRDSATDSSSARRQQRLGVAVAAAAVNLDRARRVAAQQRRKVVAVGTLGEAGVIAVAERP